MDLTTHLHWACYFGRFELARVLLKHGARTNAENIRGETPLHLVSRGQNDSQEGVGVVQLLLGHGANINAQDKGQITPSHLASYYGRLDIVRVLLSHGASVNTKGELGLTALHLVLDGNRSGLDGIRIVRLLLENGADVNAQDSNNETPLHLACNHGKLAIGRVLMIHGANANAANIRGQTPLHMLSLWPWQVEDKLELVEILGDGGADVNARDKDHETPLHMAYRNNMLDIACRLVILIQMQAQRTTKVRPRSSSESRRLASHSVATATNRPVEFIADYDRDMEITDTDCNFLYNRQTYVRSAKLIHKRVNKVIYSSRIVLHMTER